MNEMLKISTIKYFFFFVATPPGPTIGFLPVLRGALDGAQLWTMVQTKGFATAGILFALLLNDIIVIGNF